MGDDAITEALTRSVQINVLAYNWEKPRAEWVLPLPGAPLAQVRLPEVRQWGYRATVSPDGQTVAVAVSFTPPPPATPLFEAESEPLPREPWTVALVDVSSGTHRFCSGDFDRSPYPPAWRADANAVAVGPPFEPRNVYHVDIGTGTLRRTEFRRHAPAPFLDAEFLDLK